MIKILKMIAGNVADERATVALPGSVPTPVLFRGAVSMNTEKCIGCGICSYVCVSNAILGADQGKTYDWSYEPGRCTFCGRCMERCPAHALSMEPGALPSYEHPGERSKQCVVEFRACPECGDPVRFASDEFLKQAFDYVKDETRALVHLCPRCRRRHLQRSLIATAFVNDAFVDSAVSKKEKTR